MDKNTRKIDACSRFQWSLQSKDYSAPGGSFLNRVRSIPISKPLPPYRRFFLLSTALSLILTFAPGDVHSAAEERPTATITPAGKILIRDGTVVPPFSKEGKWTEVEGKRSDRYDTRHFICIVPGGPPAIELIVTSDRNPEPPDGVFEFGLVRGFLAGFASKAGFKADNFVFKDQVLGPAKVKRALVKLTNDRQTLWVHAYIYPRKPSLTFISIRAQDGAQMSIERYLATVDVK